MAETVETPRGTLIPHSKVVVGENTLFVDRRGNPGEILVTIATVKLRQIVGLLDAVVDAELSVVSVSVASTPKYLLTVFKCDEDEVHYLVTTVV